MTTTERESRELKLLLWAVLVMAFGVMVLALRGMAENSLLESEKRRAISIEESIREIQAMQQSPQK